MKSKILKIPTPLLLSFWQKATESVENKAEEVQNEERKCYVCYSCSRVDHAQSIMCQGEGENQCMVSTTSQFKMHFLHIAMGLQTF